MRILLLAGILVASLLPLPVPAEEPPPDAPAKPPASDPAAVALLDRAIAAQGPAEYAIPGAIKDLTVRISARVWNYDKQPPQMVALGVNRFLTLDPERFRSEWKTSADTQVQGFDGQRYWYMDSETNRFLLGDETARDRQEIRDEIDETRHLLKLFFLANLKVEGAIFDLAPDETIEVFEQEIPCKVVRRTNSMPTATDPVLLLHIDAETATLRKASALASRPGEKTITFLLRYDEEVQPRVKGVLFPYRIEIWDQPFDAPRGRIAVSATLEADGGVDFNSGLDPAIFRRPAPK
ncbi:MAG: hypothetical protein MUE73_16115 [Planctomycetes bacterium]|jgi:hypothetical protein|nr:hypothetical protein [Planctomycetota bacterium]